MSEIDKTGGPAFPEAIAVSPAGDVYPGMSGMTLRDYFAAAALTGLIARVPADRVSALSYKAADDMLTERMKYD